MDKGGDTRRRKREETRRIQRGETRRDTEGRNKEGYRGGHGGIHKEEEGDHCCLHITQGRDRE